MRRIKKTRKWWRKHPQCKIEYCKTGIVGDFYECLCGGSGVRMEYCDSCYGLWKKDFEKFKHLAGKQMYRIPSPEEIVKYVLGAEARRRQAKKK